MQDKLYLDQKRKVNWRNSEKNGLVEIACVYR